MNVLTLEVGVVPGTSLLQAVEEAAEIARKLGLAWVDLEINGARYTIYPSGEKLEHPSNE